MPLRRPVPTTTIIAISAAVLVLSLGVRPVTAQIDAIPLQNMQLDASALVLARGGNFSHVINGSPFQQEVLLTYEGYQFASWYHNGAEQDIFLSRRELGGNTWETIDTGYDMEIGNQNWDSHNVISLGISGDGRVHLSYDHHVDPLRYLTTDPGFATSSSQVWSQAGFAPERSSLNSNGSTIPRVSYPRFTNVGDDLVLTYRDYGSGSGDVRIADYDATTGQWSSTRFVNRGRPGNGIYDDVNNNPSDRRNAYHNGFHSDSTGRLHTTWTWREGTQDGNHDINYAYSDDRGVTWRNNDGALVGTSSAPITLDSPGVEIVDLDRRHALLNQQGQIVDPEGVVHALMFHRPKGPTYSNSPFSDRNGSDYHHYYRDPLTGDWQVNQFPSSISVGSRPRIGVDGFGHLFAAYTHNDDLVIVGSEKIAGGYSEWKVLHRDRSRNFEGTPQLDTQRLLEDGVLSLLIQEETPTPSQTLPSGTPLHVREFSTITPTVHTLRSGSADGALRARKLTGEVSGEGLNFVINSDELNVGQSGVGADPFDRAAVMVFQLPDLGSIEDPFQVARFQGHLTQTVSSGGVGGDLYGLVRRDTPEILNTDYFGGSDVADPESVLLEDDLLVEGMPTGTPFVTSAVGGANLVAFLNEQYAGGTGAGDYVFLRLNTDADTTQRWSLNSGGVADEMLRPQLLFNALEGDFLNGDYNRDGVVDAADYTVWRDSLGAAAGTLPNDPHGGTIGEGQLVVWRNYFGTTLAAPANTSVIVPEPGTNGCVLTVILASYALGNRRGERKCVVDRLRGGRMCKATSGDRCLPRGQRRRACVHLASGILLLVLTTALVSGSVLASPLTEPIREPTLSFTERDGMVVVEAEDFFEQTETQARAFYRTSKHDQPAVLPDGDASHHEDASGGVYLEILPDTRRSHDDKLVVGTNFSAEPGSLAVLSYRVALTRPGRYYVWVRAFSTGTEDNGLHVGINGEWPSSGRRMQWTAKHKWYWDSKQRTKEVHTGVPGQIYLDVKRPGVHTVSFSMREDGFEFDKWLMTTDAAMPTPTRAGPPFSPTTR